MTEFELIKGNNLHDINKAIERDLSPFWNAYELSTDFVKGECLLAVAPKSDGRWPQQGDKVKVYAFCFGLEPFMTDVNTVKRATKIKRVLWCDYDNTTDKQQYFRCVAYSENSEESI